eukprot:TRINITY_DN2919_c5_g1_i1.p1 TRINITY_DN2919_c5_g1~~TRINITY_DN2919_c5_g1_i1.p1  ORF type:complete len:129 (-),score=15.86 TRINITY_DN2919_c5_g1_i1:468-854(-)
MVLSFIFNQLNNEDYSFTARENYIIRLYNRLFYFRLGQSVITVSAVFGGLYYFVKPIREHKRLFFTLFALGQISSLGISFLTATTGCINNLLELPPEKSQISRELSNILASYGYKAPHNIKDNIKKGD